MIYLNKKHRNPLIDYLKAFAIYLVIYMLQSLLVEAVLNRVINFDTNNCGIILCFCLSLVMTLICYMIVEKTIRIKIIGSLLWGTN
jgi:peptidoglycan/LPS O-acetylase OafA/YrhL